MRETMANLGNAYITIIPSMQGGAGTIAKELNGATTTAAGKSGKSFAAGFGKTALKTMGAIGLGVSAAEIFSKGWSRMTAIDEAKAKLTALGHSVEEVKAISENANAAVKGTAYGMDAAMTAAASATAAGIAPGKELTRYLGLVADAAAVAGVDMNEMGAIFNKVAANGKVTTEEMNQLADRGIPIWQLLAKETGMSMDELRKAVTNGEIDIKDFQNAIESGMGGAAKTIGSTTIKGAISNIGASLSRIGASFLGAADDGDSFAGRLLPLLNNLMSFMGKLEGGAATLGQVVGSIIGPIMDGLGQVFTEIGKGSGSLAPLKTMLVQIASVIGRIIKALFPIIIANIRMTMKVVGTVAGVIRKVVSTVSSAMSTIVAKITAAKNKIKNIVAKIKSIINKVKLKLNLKVPNVHISGGKAPWGIAGKGRPPSFRVTWAAQGGIVDGATLIGAGEKGAEAIVPLNPFWDRLESTGKIDYNMLATVLINVLSSIDRTNVMVVDGKVVARSTAPYMRKEINRLDTNVSRAHGLVGV